MITFETGDIFGASVEALVNPVNTEGVMGAGLARQFKVRFPDNFNLYRQACRRYEVSVGHMFITPVMNNGILHWIINFPTKHTWAKPSQMVWIDAGLWALKHALQTLQIRSVAIPALGSGLGGLDWPDVRERIVFALADLPDTDIRVFGPLQPDV